MTVNVCAARSRNHCHRGTVQDAAEAPKKSEKEINTHLKFGITRKKDAFKNHMEKAVGHHCSEKDFFLSSSHSTVRAQFL